MSEPAQILLDAAMAALAPYRVELRRRGWDAQLYVEMPADEPPAYVALRIRLPELAPPLEAAQSITPPGYAVCEVCDGAGQVPGEDDEPEECVACAGRGMVAA